GPQYDACHYDAIEITYGSGQAINVYAKWDEAGEFAPRSLAIPLPATTGISTHAIPLSSFSDVDCSALTEFQFEPVNASTGFGIAVYDVRFITEVCTDGALRCGPGGSLQECVEGAWTSSSCGPGQHCQANQCVEDGTTPVDLHGHLAVSGTHLV